MERPSGTITFLFTDIVGSTRLWESHPLEMRQVLAEHERILRSVFEDHGGYVFTTGGDSFSVAFTTPDAAIRAALAGQRDLQNDPFEPVGGLAVRMAIHTGLAEERDGDYFGPPLNRVARMLSVAAGGRIVVSQTVAGMVRYSLPDGTHLRDLGKVQLKDVSIAEHLWEVTTTDAKAKRFKRLGLMVGAAAITALATAVVVSFPSGDESSSTTTAELAPTTSTGTVSIPWLWGQEIDGKPISLFTVGPGVYVAYRTDGEYHLAAFDGYTGTPKWEFDTADGPARYVATDAEGPATDLSTDPDGYYIYVVSGAWLEVLHPNGRPIPGCATRLPISVAGVAVDARGVYVLGGSTLHLVKSNPGGSLCMEIREENPTAGRGALPVFGPSIAGNLIVTGDGLAVYGWDAAGLQLQWQYPQSGSLSVKGLHVEYRQQSSVQGTVNQTTVLVNSTDPEASWKLIHLDPNQPSGQIEIASREVDRAAPPIVYHDLIGVVEPAGDLVFYDLGLEVEVSRYPGPISAAVSTESFVVTVGQSSAEDDSEGYLIRWLRPADGSIRDEIRVATGRIVGLSGNDDLIHVVTEEGGLYAYPARPGTIPQAGPTVKPPLPTAMRDPIAAVEALHEALNTGSVQRTRQHLAVGALLHFGIPDGTLWSDIYRHQYWEPHVEADGLLGAQWTVSDCTSSPRTRGGPGDLVECELTFTNNVRNAAGESPVTKPQSFVVYHGLIYEFGEQSSTIRSPALGALDAWLQLNLNEAWNRICQGKEAGSGLYQGQPIDVECSRLRAEHLDEWAASLDS
jgi:class 3 adenylate cyclase